MLKTTVATILLAAALAGCAFGGYRRMTASVSPAEKDAWDRCEPFVQATRCGGTLRSDFAPREACLGAAAGRYADAPEGERVKVLRGLGCPDSVIFP